LSTVALTWTISSRWSANGSISSFSPPQWRYMALRWRISWIGEGDCCRGGIFASTARSTTADIPRICLPSTPISPLSLFSIIVPELIANSPVSPYIIFVYDIYRLQKTRSQFDRGSPIRRTLVYSVGIIPSSLRYIIYSGIYNICPLFQLYSHFSMLFDSLLMCDQFSVVISSCRLSGDPFLVRDKRDI
jgi:hypothetical protein